MLILNKITMSDINFSLKEIKNSYSYNDIELIGFDFNEKIEALKSTLNSIYGLINKGFHEYESGLSKLDLNYIIGESSRVFVNNEIEMVSILRDRECVRGLLKVIYFNISNKVFCLYDIFERLNLREVNTNISEEIKNLESSMKIIINKIRSHQDGKCCEVTDSEGKLFQVNKKERLIEIENLKKAMVVCREKIISLQELQVMSCKIEEFILMVIDVVSSWFISVSDYDIYLKDSASWYGLDDILIEQKNNLISFITK